MDCPFIKRESLVSPCGHLISSFHYTHNSELVEELPHKHVTCVSLFLLVNTARTHGLNGSVFPLCLYDKTILHGRLEERNLEKNKQ